MKLLQLAEPIIKAEEELISYRMQGQVTPERIYQLVLEMTGDEKVARQKQSELALAQMPPIPAGKTHSRT